MTAVTGSPRQEALNKTQVVFSIVYQSLTEGTKLVAAPTLNPGLLRLSVSVSHWGVSPLLSTVLVAEQGQHKELEVLSDVLASAKHLP